MFERACAFWCFIAKHYLRVWVLAWCFLAAHSTCGQVYQRSTKQTRRIYQASYTGLTVDVEIDFCDVSAANNNKVKIKYNYNGRLLIADRYAVWKMRYRDENGRVQVRQFSTAIGGGEIRGELGDSPVNQTRVIDEPFSCKSILDLFYDIGVSDYPLSGTVESTGDVIESAAPVTKNQASGGASSPTSTALNSSLISFGIGVGYIKR